MTQPRGIQMEPRRIEKRFPCGAVFCDYISPSEMSQAATEKIILIQLDADHRRMHEECGTQCQMGE